MGLGGMLDGMMGGGASGGGPNIRPGNTGALSQFQGSLKDMSHAQRAAHFPGFVDGQTAPPPGWGGITINEAQATQNLDPLFAQARATGQTDFTDPLSPLWGKHDTTGGISALNRSVSARDAAHSGKTVAEMAQTHYRARHFFGHGTRNAVWAASRGRWIHALP